MTKCNTNQLLDPHLEAYLNTRRQEISTALDHIVGQISTPGQDTPENRDHRQALLGRLCELDTLRQTMEADETARRQRDLDNFEASLNGTNERDDIIKQYDVSRDGVIHSPGKFEGEMLYAVYYWDWVLNSEGEDMEDRDEITWTVLEVSREDRDLFPEINRAVYKVALREDEQGFVHMIDTSTPRFDELGTAEDRAERDEHDDTPSIELEGTIMDPSL